MCWLQMMLVIDSFVLTHFCSYYKTSFFLDQCIILFQSKKGLKYVSHRKNEKHQLL